jgi:short-subunit dehydrogenase
VHNKKVVVITGASSGIGLACAREFARNGSSVVLAARSLDTIESLSRELRSEGKEAFAIQTDVSDEMQCKTLIESAISKYNRIDVLINNAGISMRALFCRADMEVLRRVMNVNFWGTVYCTKYALPHLLETKGTVAGISSIAGFQGLPGRTGYSASKFAMHGFLEAVRAENRNTGLHVLIAAPGFTASNIRKAALMANGSEQGGSPRTEEKLMPAEEVARHIYRAVVKRKRSLILTSGGKFTVFLKKFAPGLLEKLIFDHFVREPDSPLKTP